MNFKRLSKRTSVLALALAVGACDQGLTDINQNPNAPENVEAFNLLPQGIQRAASLVLGYNLNLDLTELWVQHIAEIQYAEEDNYELRGSDINGAWEDLYTGPLMDFQMIVKKGAETKKSNHEAVGTIMKAWTYSAMTDLWGDIPFSQALTGNDEGGTITPKYDSQADIYAALIVELEKANDLIAAGGAGSFGSEDLIYGGDMEQWRKFANSLRLRLAMRMSEVDAEQGRAAFAAALDDGVFASNSDNAQLVYLGNSPNQHPWFVNFKTRDDHRVSQTLVNTLKDLADPRLGKLASPIADDPTGMIFIGMPNGMEEHDFKWTGTSEVGAFFQVAEQPAQFMTYAEVLFLQAEAAERGWTAGDAAALYAAAITANMEYYGVESDAIDDYLAQASVAYSAADWRQRIGVQKWIALFGNGVEAYAEYRRLGYPVLTPGPDAVIGHVPLRYPYPDSEQSFNNDNLQAAKGAQGGATLDVGVWWDK